MTYKGQSYNSNKTTTDINAVARAICSFNMRKILDALTIVTTILGILGGGFFTFKYVTSEQFKAKMMNQVLDNVKGLMPDVLGKSLPSETSKQIPTFPINPKIMNCYWCDTELIIGEY